MFSIGDLLADHLPHTTRQCATRQQQRLKNTIGQRSRQQQPLEAATKEYLERRGGFSDEARYQVAVSLLQAWGEEPGYWDEPTIAGRLADLSGWQRPEAGETPGGYERWEDIYEEYGDEHQQVGLDYPLLPREAGVEVHLLSGDTEAAARAVASAVGIEHVTAEVLPGDKAAQVSLFMPFIIIYAANMYFQSFGAVAVVKVNAPWFHVRERGVFGAIFGILISLGIYFAYQWGDLILEYLGLPWEDQCLRFYETERAINTASSEQVRQPIYKSGLDYWRNYEPWLGPLESALGDVLELYPTAPQPASARS